ncbi:MAG: hypothetical protein V1797_06670 [Pseudomonadota bacterium]
MAKRGFDVVVVRRSGPVSSFSMRGGWIYLLVILMLVLTAAVAGGGYLLWQQQTLVTEMTEETRMLSLRAERLEALSQEQETREILAQQAAEERQASPDKDKGRGKSAAPAPAAASPAAAEAQAPAGGGAAESIRAAENASEEPSKSDYITINNIEQKVEGGDLVVSFDLVNEREDKEPVSGYISLLAQGTRNGKPWIEAWPPQRLNPSGRPQNFRRGTPFSVQRYRHFRARVAAVNDKEFQNLEFVIYSRQGELALVHTQALEPGAKSAEPRR